MTWHTSQDDQVGQDDDHIGRVPLAIDPGGQALPAELVDHVEHEELSSIMNPALDEVAGPDVVRPLRPQTDTRPVTQPEPSLLGLLLPRLQLRRGNALLSPFLILLSSVARTALHAWCSRPWQHYAAWL